MKRIRGASSIFYLIAGVSFVALLLAAPYPHYNPENKAWFLGASIGSRIMGAKEASGVPVDRLVMTVSRAAVTSPLAIECSVDTDCKEYVVANQCLVYCGNLSEENLSATAQLNNQRVCDPALWDPPKPDCRCVAGKCVSLK